MPAEHWTTFCHIQQMTSGNWWLTLTYFATFFCIIFRIFKPSDALKMFTTIEADFQTDWNKCPENGGKSSRGLPEITKVNLWNSKRQKKHLIQVLCQRETLVRQHYFSQETNNWLFWLGWVDWNRWRANNRPSGGDHQMGEGIKFLGGKWMNIESEKNIQRFKVLFFKMKR